MFLTVTDITETKTIERAEREIRDRLRAVIDHLPAGVVLKDEPGGDLLANQQVLEIYGLQGREVVGSTRLVERRVGEEYVSTRRRRCTPCIYTKNNIIITNNTQ